MAGFLYYRPGNGLVNLGEAKELGLEYAFDGGTPAGVNGVSGPDGGRGTLFADRKRLCDQTIRYAPVEQTWRKMPGFEVWVGFYSEARPTPEDLARPKMLGGPYEKIEVNGAIVVKPLPMLLADDNDWQIPLVRRFDELASMFASNLPHVIGMDEAGNWTTGDVVAKHAPLWLAVGRFVDYLSDTVAGAEEADTGEVEAVYTMTDELDTVAELLAANYVVSKVEIAMLGLLAGEAMILDVLMAAADWKTFTDWANSKKNEVHDTPSTEVGQPVA